MTQEEKSETRDSETSSQEDNKHPGFLNVLQSVLAAMIGVQSEKKREKDFEGGYLGSYIFIGVVMTVLFVLSIVWFANWVVDNSGT
jgi:hypothetical protein